MRGVMVMLKFWFPVTSVEFHKHTAVCVKFDKHTVVCMSAFSVYTHYCVYVEVYV